MHLRTLVPSSARAARRRSVYSFLEEAKKEWPSNLTARKQEKQSVFLYKGMDWKRCDFM